MPAEDQDVEMWQGDTFVITIPVRDAAGAPINLSTLTSARWWMGKGPKSTGSDVYLKKSDTSGDGIVVTLLETDLYALVITILPTDTETMTKFGALYHEAEIVDSLGRVSTISVGKFTLNPTMVRNL